MTLEEAKLYLTKRFGAPVGEKGSRFVWFNQPHVLQAHNAAVKNGQKQMAALRKVKG